MSICPDSMGMPRFDFDGATFSYVDELVTFEVLLASFGLETDAGLAALGRLVHYLDVGVNRWPRQRALRPYCPDYARPRPMMMNYWRRPPRYWMPCVSIFWPEISQGRI